MSRKFTEQEQIRREKIQTLEKENLRAFNQTIKPTTNSEIIDKKFSSLTREEIESQEINEIFNGRVLAQRGPFIVLNDRYGNLQIYIDKKNIRWKFFKHIKTIRFRRYCKC
ncbi:hypothetical protein [Mycoplasma struthionis]|uniref:hypothetical protein n=1 Tax=Mycoplasma struthionis TaxID=538220 RepID=UPI002FDF4D69